MPSAAAPSYRVVTRLPYLLFQMTGFAVLLLRVSPRGYSQILEPRSASNQSIVRPVTVWPSLPKYTAREQASEVAGASKDAESSEAMAMAMRDFIGTPWLMGDWGCHRERRPTQDTSASRLS